jgi:2-beta-glucuronyltransferase
MSKPAGSSKTIQISRAATHDAQAGTRVVLISEHDYRTKRRAGFQQIADGIARIGYQVTFISVRYSFLSLLRGDSRNALRANRPELRDGVTCYLWRTVFHPFNIKSAPGLAPLTSPLYRLYRQYPNRFVDDAIRSASVIVVESGLSALLLKRARALNKRAKIVYYASDNLDMIGAHRFVQRSLEQSGDAVDYVCLASARMAPQFDWSGGRLFVVPHGINREDFLENAPSPYGGAPLNAVSVGSGLFDSGFFQDVAPAFPEVTFHVIGSGCRASFPPNVRLYDEMKFTDTLPFIKHASFGIAPYRSEAAAGYVVDSSLKLMQYEFVGIPAVCPDFVVGGRSSRFGYVPGDGDSSRKAVRAALAARGRVRPWQNFLTWADVAKRILDPQDFADTGLVAAA